MKPDPPRVLQGVMMNLVINVMPEVSTPHGQQTVQLAAGLANMVAQEFERAADRLVVEREALQRLFAGAAGKVSDAGLRQRLDEAGAAGPPGSLRVSALEAENATLRQLLIELHEQVESSTEPWAPELDAAIWDELKESTRRRHLNSGLA